MQTKIKSEINFFIVLLLCNVLIIIPLFAEKHLYDRLSHGFERVGINVVHRVVYRVPCRSESALRTGLDVGNDVDGENTELFVHGNDGCIMAATPCCAIWFRNGVL